MGSCIICGTSVDGRVCELHEEDVVFEFKGSSPNQLTPNRYYRGTVDGYADFGIFVDIGDQVTGLLHKSELDQRLESVDLDPGDTVYVQVQDVRDNGNVDLGWSIRQDKSRFRGVLIDDPESGDRLPDEDDEDEDGGQASRDGGPVKQRAGGRAGSSAGPDSGEASPTTQQDEEKAPSDDDGGQAAAEPVAEPTEATITELPDLVGDVVRLEGEIESARQTSGPTVFELRDETGSVECAAFEEAGVRAYPEVDEGDVVRLEGRVEERRGELQVETEALVVLEDDERAAVADRMEAAMAERARPESVEPLAEDPAVGPIAEDLRDAATAVRRAVIEGRPVVVRHAATADGYIAGAAIERATLPRIRAEHQGPDVEYHNFERRPLEGSVYDLNDATRDVTMMLSDQSRHGEQLPLFVFVAAGGTTESLDGFDLLDVYGARRVVVDQQGIEEGVAEAVDVLVSPPADGPDTTATVLAANVAVAVNDDVREDLAHLPAASFWDEPPQVYVDLAAEAGYDADAVRRLREAVALEAHYHSYEDKRELIVDLLFAEEAEDPMGLAEHVSEQYRTRIGTAVETAMANIERRPVGDETVLVLDTDAYTHRFEFPPERLLLDELYRRERDEVAALVGIGLDEAFVRTDRDVDVRDLVAAASEQATAAALDARGAREGRIEFLAGEREAAREAIIEALGAELSSPPTP